MKTITPFVAFGLIISIGTGAADLNISNSPLEIPQGAAPNIVVIMDDSSSMDWEIMTSGHNNGGLFAYNQKVFVAGDNGDQIRHKAFTGGGGTCAIADTTFNWGYMYGVEFGSNLFTDDPTDCNTADELAWRFRNSDYNPLYYNPNRRYLPWPGLSSYKPAGYPDGVPYKDLVSVFKAENGLNALAADGDYLLGVDNPTNPTEWLDLKVHNTNYTSTAAHTVTSDKPLNGVAADGVADGFSYFTWTDDGDGLFEGYFDAADNNRYVGPDGVVEVRVNTLTTAQQENFQNWFNFYRSREFSVKGSLHFVLEDMITARIGYTTINSTARNFPVATMNPSPFAVGGNKAALLNKIDTTVPNGGTPLRRALKGVGEYFSASATSDNRFGSEADPYLPADAGGSCQQNYSLLFTDGYWNGGTPSVGNQDADDGANDFDGWIFADDVSDTLADVAMKYYKNDLRTTYANDVPVTADDLARSNGAFSAGEETMHQHMKTYTVAFGLNWIGDFVPSTTSSWPNPNLSEDGKLFDLFHAAFNGRGDFYVANDYQTLASRLRDGFSKILAEQSGAAGVSFNSQELKTGTYIFRAFYNPATFDGDLVAIEFDQNGVPLVDTPVWSASEQLNNVIEDGERLIVTFDPDANMGVPFDYDTGLNATQKGYFQTLIPATIPTGYGDDDGDYADERVDFLYGDETHEGTRFDNGELRDRAGLLGDFANSTPRYVGIPQGVKRDSEPYPTSIGNLYSEFKSTYLDRAQLVYAGANDGMLHGFDAVSGREKFAFVPNVVMDDLYEFTLPGYLHEMSVDGSPGINDIFLDDDGVSHWRSILMGGLRAGGKGYYALDITDPDTFTEADMPDNVLWEFTNANDDRLGLTFSTPNMVMSNVDMDCGVNADTTPCVTKRWISLFGNGYNQTNTAQESALFALFIDRGGDNTWYKTALGSNYTNDDWIVMQTGVGGFTEGGITYPNGLGVPRAIDIDGNGTADYVYAGDLVGNLYRFDISSSDPADWAMSQILFKADYEVSTGVKSRQPITVQPIATINEGYGGYNIIVSTGSWMTIDDVTSTTVQSLYGIWDKDPSVVRDVVIQSELVEQSFTNVKQELLGFTYRTLSASPVGYVIPSGKKARVMGWKIDLDMCVADTTGCASPEYGGERAIRNLLVKEGVLFGVTILPSSNAYCSDSPGGYLFSIDAQTGGLVPERPGFDLNADGSFDINDINDANGDETINDNEVPAAIRIEDGLPSDIAVIDGGSSAGSKVCYQTSTGALVCTNANVDSKFPEGRLSWKELAD
jgi:type IV pilus assembly protein PilY1